VGGGLEYIRIAIEPPSEFIFVDEKLPPPPWFFQGFNREQVLALFAQADLTAGQQQALAQPERWQIKPEGRWLFPDVETVLDLSPGARERIYKQLAMFPEDEAQNTAFSFNPQYLPERLEGSGLLDDSINLFKRLLYPHGSTLLFGDMNTVLPRLPDQHERIRFANAQYIRPVFRQPSTTDMSRSRACRALATSSWSWIPGTRFFIPPFTSLTIWFFAAMARNSPSRGW
jgi:hypothetical protein